MTGWAGPAPQREKPRLGFIQSLAVVLLPWRGADAATTDGPCVVTEPEPEAG